MCKNGKYRSYISCPCFCSPMLDPRLVDTCGLSIYPLMCRRWSWYLWLPEPWLNGCYALLHTQAAVSKVKPWGVHLYPPLSHEQVGPWLSLSSCSCSHRLLLLHLSLAGLFLFKSQSQGVDQSVLAQLLFLPSGDSLLLVIL